MAKVGEAVPVEVIAVNKDGVVFRTPHGDAWLSPPDAPGMAVSVQPDRVEITDKRGPWLTYARQVSEAVDANSFMQDYDQHWHAQAKKLSTGWVNVQWYRGVNPKSLPEQYLSLAQVKWHEKYLNWLDKIFPFDAGHYVYVADWLQSAKDRGLQKKYKKTPEGRNLPALRDPEDPPDPPLEETVVSALLDGEMSPENFVKDFSSEWSYKLSINPDSYAGLQMKFIATFYLGFDRVGNRYVSNDEAAEWYLKLIKWLDTRLPFQKFRHIKSPLPLRKDTDQFPFDNWILSAKAKGLIDRFKTIFGESP